MVTAKQIKQLCPKAKADLVDAIVRGWSKALAAGISTPRRIRQFLANIAAETGGLSTISESMNYTTPERLMKVWPSRFKTVEEARPYVRKPRELAIKVYGGRMGNAPAPSDDGWVYRGAGMLQTTGREGFRRMGYENNPEALRDPDIAFDTAVREWTQRKLNPLADAYETTAIRKKINGGTNGLAEVQKYLKKAESIWPDGAQAAPAPGVVAEDVIETVQRKLRDLGYTEVGRPDGKIGNMTRTAILAFRLDNGLPLIPEIDDEFLQALSKAQPRQLAPERKGASPSEIRKEVPEVSANFWSKVVSAITALFSGSAALLGGVAENFAEARGYIDPLSDYLTSVPGWVWLLIIAITAATIFYVSRKGELQGIEAFKTGSRR